MYTYRLNPSSSEPPGMLNEACYVWIECGTKFFHRNFCGSYLCKMSRYRHVLLEGYTKLQNQSQLSYILIHLRGKSSRSNQQNRNFGLIHYREERVIILLMATTYASGSSSEFWPLRRWIFVYFSRAETGNFTTQEGWSGIGMSRNESPQFRQSQSWSWDILLQERHWQTVPGHMMTKCDLVF